MSVHSHCWFPRDSNAVQNNRKFLPKEKKIYQDLCSPAYTDSPIVCKRQHLETESIGTLTSRFHSRKARRVFYALCCFCSVVPVLYR